MDRDDWRAHEILLNVQSGEPCEIVERDSYGNIKSKIPNPKRLTYSSHECYFKSPQQMSELFKDVPDAVSNTLDVMEKCYVEIDLNETLPCLLAACFRRQRKLYEGRASQSRRRLFMAAVQRRYSQTLSPERLAKVQEIYPGKDPLEVVKERLNYEMDVIVPKGISDYLLIVWDFINWAKRNAIPMGPGRGSGRVKCLYTDQSNGYRTIAVPFVL